MDKDEIIRMAEKACSPNQILNTDPEFLERFAALVAAHEREACAKLAENWDFNVQGLVKAIKARDN